MKISFTRIMLSVILLFSAGIAYAAPSKDGRFPGPKDAVRPREVINVYDAKLNKMRAIRKRGIINVAVIPVQFTSAGSQTSSAGDGTYKISSADLRTMATNLASMHNFFDKAAYGIVDIQFTIIFSTCQAIGPQQISGSETGITLNHPMSYYANIPTSAGYLPDGSGGGQQQLIEDAVTAAAATAANVSSGSFDTVIVVHAGYGNESTAGGSQTNPTNPGDIWSVQVDLGGPDAKAGGFGFGIVIPMLELGASPFGVSCHEFGHYLGLPDMYNTNNGNSEVGDWCLMDDGLWQNNGLSPNYPCTWCRNYLGLLSPQLISSSQQISSLVPVEASSSSICQFNVPGSDNEYFLVSFTTTTYNPNDPGTGVLIWHVDEGTIHGESFAQRIALNNINCFAPLTAALVTANGVTLSTNYTGGRGDPWPGHKLAFTVSDSNSYSGYPSGITLYNFQLSASSASFYASISTAPFQGAVDNSLGGAHPFPSFAKLSQGDKVNFMGITPNAELKIFTVAGNLVQTFKADSNGLVPPWDGSVEGGGKAGSGTYLIRVSDSMGNKKILKVLILR